MADSARQTPPGGAVLASPFPTGGSFEPQLEISCAEPAGQEIENTFLILTAEAGEKTWRILARMRVRVDAGGVPHPVTERIDAQEVGFSGHG